MKNIKPSVHKIPLKFLYISGAMVTFLCMLFVFIIVMRDPDEGAKAAQNESEKLSLDLAMQGATDIADMLKSGSEGAQSPTDFGISTEVLKADESTKSTESEALTDSYDKSEAESESDYLELSGLGSTNARAETSSSESYPPSEADSRAMPDRTASLKREFLLKAISAPTRVSLSSGGLLGGSMSTPVTNGAGISEVSTALRADTAYADRVRESGFDRHAQTLSRYDDLRNDSYELDSEVQPLKSPYALMQGSLIEAVLLNGISSELPGMISAQVTRDIRDSVNGEHLLVPKGSKLIGQYGASASFGAERLFLGFNRIIFPDGSSLNIGAMPGQSPDGYAGFDADVDNHYLRIIANCLILSTITSTQSNLERAYTAADGTTTTIARHGTELSSDLSAALSEIIRRNINLSPTLKVRPGYRFSMVIAKDIYFKHPYGVSYENYLNP